MKFVPASVTNKLARQALHIQKASPKLLLIGGIVGSVGATVLACRATLKMDEVITKAQENLEIANTLEHKDYSEQDRQKDKVYIYVQTIVRTAKLYAPAVALGSLSICALVGSHKIMSSRNTALAAAYGVLDKAFDEYRKRVETELGPDRERDIRYAVETKETKNESTGKVKKTKHVSGKDHSPYARFFDEYNRNWQREGTLNQMFISCQQNYANDLLRSRGHVFLNEVYDMLGMERTSAGAVVGWVLDDEGDNYVDFGVFDGDIFEAVRFVNGEERSILLDFNVDGIVYDKI
jgi:hypothetical protein